MFRYALIGIMLVHCCGPAIADAEDTPVLRLGDTLWELYRPKVCDQALFDLEYVTDGLRAGRPGLGLRYRRAESLELNLRFDLFSDYKDFVGPVYDPHIGATILSVAFHF